MEAQKMIPGGGFTDSSSGLTPSTAVVSSHKGLLTRSIACVYDRVLVLDSVDYLTNDSLSAVGNGINRNEIDSHDERSNNTNPCDLET